MKHIFFYQTNIGKISIVQNDTAITHLYLCRNIIPQDAIIEETTLLKEAGQQLNEYLAGKRALFEIPLSPEGTEFQQRVWRTLQQIPYGETRSYGEIAKTIGQPKACRAVGMANGKNPIPVIIPCHRVIGANKKLVGYLGGLNMKENLLSLEKKYATS